MHSVKLLDAGGATAAGPVGVNDLHAHPIIFPECSGREIVCTHAAIDGEIYQLDEPQTIGTVAGQSTIPRLRIRP
jgi:hypothetical protein